MWLSQLYISGWMANNRLWLNAKKTDIIIIGATK